MKKIFIGTAALLLLATGFIVLMFPNIQIIIFKHNSRETIEQFEEASVGAAKQSRDGYDGEESGSVPYEKLQKEMQAYNKEIYENHQAELRDAWSYQQNVFDFKSEGIKDDMIGFITIEAMDVKIPLYIGADEENLRVGAAVLSQTSMPVGGENTNCVIAAHRGGYYGAAMFRDIELLKPGDMIRITNLWETLEYEVVKTIVIYPDDIDKVKIFDGEDMVTLVTCHPYGNNYERYVVYCRRKTETAETSGEKETEKITAQKGKNVENFIVPYDGIEYTSSVDIINKERILNYAGMMMFAVLALILICTLLAERKKKRKKNKRV